MKSFLRTILSLPAGKTHCHLPWINTSLKRHNLKINTLIFCYFDCFVLLQASLFHVQHTRYHLGSWCTIESCSPSVPYLFPLPPPKMTKCRCILDPIEWHYRHSSHNLFRHGDLFMLMYDFDNMNAVCATLGGDERSVELALYSSIGRSRAKGSG